MRHDMFWGLATSSRVTVLATAPSPSLHVRAHDAEAHLQLHTLQAPRPQTDGQATSPRQLLLLLFSADTVGSSRREANSVKVVASRCSKDQRDRATNDHAVSTMQHTRKRKLL